MFGPAPAQSATQERHPKNTESPRYVSRNLRWLTSARPFSAGFAIHWLASRDFARGVPSTGRLLASLSLATTHSTKLNSEIEGNK